MSMKIEVFINGMLVAGNAADWAAKVLGDKIHSTSNPQETLELLMLGVAPSRGSKGSRKETWEVEMTALVKSLMKKYDIAGNLRESGGMDTVVKELIRKTGKPNLLEELTIRAKHLAEIKSASLTD
jgi:hypothetical protein